MSGNKTGDGKILSIESLFKIQCGKTKYICHMIMEFKGCGFSVTLKVKT